MCAAVHDWSGLWLPVAVPTSSTHRQPNWETCTDCNAMRRVCACARARVQDAGVPTPLHMLIQRPGQLKEAAETVGFPSVLKPIGGSESIGVVRVDDEAQLADCYEQLQATMRATAYKDGSLSTFDDETDAEGSVSSRAACMRGMHAW